MIRIKRGLNLPIQGEPQQKIVDEPKVRRVALVGPDYIGMKPTMLVKEGDTVQLGQKLFEDKKNLGVFYTSPGAGVVAAIHRGDKRKFLAIEIELGAHAEKTFQKFSPEKLSSLNRMECQELLIESGLWTVFRTRPYSKSPRARSLPKSIFVTAMDTNPLSAKPGLILKDYKEDFENGLKVLTRLTDGPVYLCKDFDGEIPGATVSGVSVQEFSGPHPAGLSGTHIHFVDPVGESKTVWSVGYQDVIAIGKLFTTGKLWVERVISLAGPLVKNPRLVRTRLGASLEDLVRDQLDSTKEARVISGSVLSGRTASGPHSFLGRFHYQVSVIEEGRKREFLGWQLPGFGKFSIKNVYAGKLLPGKHFAFTTSTQGSPRAMVPVGSYEKVMPLDIIAPYFLRALIIQDTEASAQLGALELDEEDLSLCTFVDPGKTDFGPLLRSVLTTIEKEG